MDDAIQRGAQAIIGGREPDRPRHFYEPTVLREIPADAKLRHAELFGPVAPVFIFGNGEQAINEANDTEYGLVSFVFTRDLDRALRVSEAATLAPPYASDASAGGVSRIGGETGTGPAGAGGAAGLCAEACAVATQSTRR